MTPKKDYSKAKAQSKNEIECSYCGLQLDNCDECGKLFDNEDIIFCDSIGQNYNHICLKYCEKIV